MRPPRDPGLQAERTALAWRRTGLALAANALLILRAGAVYRQAPVLALGAALVMAAIVTGLIAAQRHRQLSGAAVPLAPPAAAMLAVACLSGLAALSGMAAIVLSSAGR